MRRLLSAMLHHMLTAPVQRRLLQLTRVAAFSRVSDSNRKRKILSGRFLTKPLVESPTQCNGDAAAELLKLQQLEVALSRHNNLYYNEQHPEISDAAYDNLKLQYRQLVGRLLQQPPEEVAMPVGAPVPSTGPLRKVPHRVPMLSLASVNSREETEAWLEKVLVKVPTSAATRRKGSSGSGGSGGGGSHQKRKSSAPAAVTAPSCQGHRWVVEPKVDGLAVRALYRRTADGTYILEEAATRGDGAVGEDVTHNALHGGIRGLPPVLAVPPSWSGGASGEQQRGAGSRLKPGSLPRIADAATTSPATGPAWVDVRGEVFVRTTDLDLVNQEQEAAGQPPFANTRNAASGAVRLLDSTECRRRRLSFVAYVALAPLAAASLASSSPSLSSPLPSSSPSPSSSSPSLSSSSPSPSSSSSLPTTTSSLSPMPPSSEGDDVAEEARPLHKSHWETLQWLQGAGFAVSEDNRLCGSIPEALAVAEAWMARRGSLGYDADGAVIKLDDTTLYDILGSAGSDPRWAVAWKFPAGEAVTQLVDVELTVGRQGHITPVAVLEPVALGGVTIRRASLHNVGLAAALDLHLGDSVLLRRSGDVIPQVMRVLPELRPAAARPWQIPSTCPSCGGSLRLLPAAHEGSGDQLLCDNTECGAKSVRKLLHFATVCLKGSNLSKGAVGQLMAAGLAREIPDFYNLDQATLSTLPGFGPARSATLLAALESSRRMSAATLLRGLNIRLVGEAAAEALGRAFPRIDDLTAASPEQIVEAAGVGPAVAGSVATWFQWPDHRDLLQRLREAGLLCIAGPSASTVAVTTTATTTTVSALTVAAKPSGTDPSAYSGPLVEEGGGHRPQQQQQQQQEKQQHQQLDQAPEMVLEGGKPPADGAAGPRLVGVAGLRVCVTGTFMGPHGTGLVRSEMKRWLVEAGAEFHTAVKKSTQVLVAGDDAGSHKTMKATANGVQVMREQEFWQRFWSEGKDSPPPPPPPFAAGGACGR